MSDGTNIIALSDRRPPTVYTIVVTHHSDGKMDLEMMDVIDDPKTRKSVARALYGWAQRLWFPSDAS